MLLLCGLPVTGCLYCPKSALQLAWKLSSSAERMDSDAALTMSTYTARSSGMTTTSPSWLVTRASDARVCRHRGVLNDTRGSNSGGSSAAGYVGAGAASSSPSRESPVGIGPTAEPAHNPRSTNIAPATRAPTRPLGHHDAGAPVSPPPRRGSASLASPVVAIGRGR